MAIQIQYRRDTAANWTSVNPILASGEVGFETDTSRFKLGTGAIAWTSLPYTLNNILNAAGAPSNSLGINGDFYINSTNYTIYGPKAAGVWPVAFALKGADGVGMTTQAVGFTVTGGTTAKTLTVALDANVAGTNTGDQTSIAGITGTIAQFNTAVSDADFAISNATQTFTGGQIGAVTALTSTSASIAINLATNNNFSHTTTENTTLAAPSNPVAGQSGVITITQGATARTLAYNTFWKFSGGTVPTLTGTANAVDVFVYNVESATRATAQLIKDVK